MPKKTAGESVPDPARLATLKRRVRSIIRRLDAEYPDARSALVFSNPLELLIALILAAQCTDERVNRVTARLFPRFRTAADWAAIPLPELEELIHETGFYRNKAKAIHGCCEALVREHGGRVPDDLEALLRLPGVGRKTANIVLGNGFGRDTIGVDTHVARLSRRLGLTDRKEPDRIEEDLMRITPAGSRVRFCHLLQSHGRRVCLARKPRCADCVLRRLCPSAGKT